MGKEREGEEQESGGEEERREEEERGEEEEEKTWTPLNLNLQILKDGQGGGVK